MKPGDHVYLRITGFGKTGYERQVVTHARDGLVWVKGTRIPFDARTGEAAKCCALGWHTALVVDETDIPYAAAAAAEKGSCG